MDVKIVLHLNIINLRLALFTKFIMARVITKVITTNLTSMLVTSKNEEKVSYSEKAVHEGRFCSQNDGNYNSKLKHSGGKDYMRACFAQVMSDPDCGGKFFFMNYPKNTECACCKNKTDKLPADQIRRTGNNNNIYRITYGE